MNIPVKWLIDEMEHEGRIIKSGTLVLARCPFNGSWPRGEGVSIDHIVCDITYSMGSWFVSGWCFNRQNKYDSFEAAEKAIEEHFQMKS